METSTHTQSTLVKLLAIVGFFSIIALIGFLLLLGVRNFPSIVSSLASIAETVNTYRPNEEFTLTLEKNIVSSGDTISVTWTDMGAGTYAFSYDCTDAMTFSVRTDEETPRELSCSDTLTLPSGTLGLFLTPRAEATRFGDMTFTITFTPESTEGADVQVTKGALAVINADVPSSVPTKSDAQTPPETTSIAVRDSDAPLNREAPRVIRLPESEILPIVLPEPSIVAEPTAPQPEEEVSVSLPVPATTTVPTSTTPVSTETNVTSVASSTLTLNTASATIDTPEMPSQTTTSPMASQGNSQTATPVRTNTPPSPAPTSGVTDLRISYRGVGVIENDVFISKASFIKGETVALRFDVTNIGTLTSGAWSYRLTLPGGLTYQSDTQAPLRFGEQALFTARFELPNIGGTNTTVGGVAMTIHDANLSNNSFTWSVAISS